MNNQKSAAAARIDVYLENSIYVIQGGIIERCQRLKHLFRIIDRVLHLNTTAYTHRKDTISQKKLGQVGTAWYTQNTVLVWNLNTVAQSLHLSQKRQFKVKAELNEISPFIHKKSLRKRRKLLGMLRSITPAVAGSRGMFTCVEHALKKATRSHVNLTAAIHNKLAAYHNLVGTLSNMPTHLHNLDPSLPTCIGDTNDPGTGMWGVCRDPEGQYFVWNSPFSATTQERLVSFTNPQIETTIKNLGIGSLIMQILLFVLWMVLLKHTRTYIDNTSSHGWAYRGTVITTSVVAEKGEFHTKYCPSRSRHTPHIPVPGALVSPIHVGREGSRLCKCVGMLESVPTRL